MLLNCGFGEDSWESLGLQGDPTSQSPRRSVLNVYWKDWCWRWNSNTLAIWYEELTHLKRPWCWERLKRGGEGDDRGWDGWITSPTQWTWVWINSRSWRWTRTPGVLQSMGLQRVGHDCVTELNWTELPHTYCVIKPNKNVHCSPYFSVSVSFVIRFSQNLTNSSILLINWSLSIYHKILTWFINKAAKQNYKMPS